MMESKLKQKYTSANTCVNSNKVPALFNKVTFAPNTINLDFGGGKYDNATNFLKTKEVKNLVYDPYNRPIEENERVLKYIEENGVDTVTCANVLNVINEEEVRENVVMQCRQALKTGGKAYFYIYEGNKTGITKINKKQNTCQLNLKTECYMPLIQKYFKTAVRKGQMIVAEV